MSFGAGNIASKLGLDISPFAQGMVQATSIAKIFPNTVQAFLASPLLGLISIAKEAATGLTDLFLSVGRAADSMGEAAEKVGVTTEFLSEVGFAAKDAGSSMEGLASGLKFLNRNAAEAVEGQKAAVEAFARVGIAVEDSSGKIKSAETLFFEVADAIKGMGSTAEKTRAAMALMGKGGDDLLPLLNQGSAGIKAMQATIEELGGGISTSLAKAGDKFGTLETLVGAAWQGIKNVIAEPILNALAENFDGIVAMIKEVSSEIKATIGPLVQSAVEWVSSHPEEIKNMIVNAMKAIIEVIKDVAEIVKFVVGHLDLFKGALEALIAIKIVSTIGAMGEAFIGLAGKIGVATEAQLALNTAMRAGGGGGLGGAGLVAGLGGVAGYATTGSTGGGIGGAIGADAGWLIGGALGGPIGAALLAGGLGYVGSQIGDSIDRGSQQSQPKNTTVNVSLDGKESSVEVAEIIRKEMRAAQERGDSETKSLIHARRVVNGLDRPWAGE